MEEEEEETSPIIVAPRGSLIINVLLKRATHRDVRSTPTILIVYS